MQQIKKNIRILFIARTIRLFAYGFISVILVLYLAAIGLKEYEIGVLLTLTLLGDVVISFWITTNADNFSRRKMLIAGSILMAAGGFIFVLTDNYIILVLTAAIGVISPSGKEIGPFLSIEQSALSELVPTKALPGVFAWYNLAGSFSTAIGALCAGWGAQLLQKEGLTNILTYKIILAIYGLIGLMLLILFRVLTNQVEVPKTTDTAKTISRFGLHSSKKIVIKLSALFALDAFAGGFILQSIFAYWFYLKFNVNTGSIGSIFFAANLIAGISSLYAIKIAGRLGLIKTMVFTHLPSNVLLLLVPLMPNLPSAIAMLLLRFSISQMDVPTRQTYTIIAVNKDERSAASGITSIARSIGASISPSLGVIFLASPALINLPFFFAGGLKIIYDIWLYHSFKEIKDGQEIGVKRTKVT
ncbi:MAG: MFS transporter [Ignavibacteria bacterium]|jgi:MFS family permease|nr:MFS transporter [Ignavibacteria bacterium]MCU7511068.1 MFS transporter [Ignavibacteria bacterium]MCU7522646.1 MFS transporter [Ignavibacteria bacterium]MCU7525899.1 MFS transporter [Ignavibacteria bacterium]